MLCQPCRAELVFCLHFAWICLSYILYLFLHSSSVLFYCPYQNKMLFYCPYHCLWLNLWLMWLMDNWKHFINYLKVPACKFQFLALSFACQTWDEAKVYWYENKNIFNSVGFMNRWRKCLTEKTSKYCSHLKNFLNQH